MSFKKIYNLDKIFWLQEDLRATSSRDKTRRVELAFSLIKMFKLDNFEATKNKLEVTLESKITSSIEERDIFDLCEVADFLSGVRIIENEAQTGILLVASFDAADKEYQDDFDIACVYELDIPTGSYGKSLDLFLKTPIIKN